MFSIEISTRIPQISVEFRYSFTYILVVMLTYDQLHLLQASILFSITFNYFRHVLSISLIKLEQRITLYLIC